MRCTSSLVAAGSSRTARRTNGSRTSSVMRDSRTSDWAEPLKTSSDATNDIGYLAHDDGLWWAGQVGSIRAKRRGVTANTAIVTVPQLRAYPCATGPRAVCGLGLS